MTTQGSLGKKHHKFRMFEPVTGPDNDRNDNNSRHQSHQHPSTLFFTVNAGQGQLLGYSVQRGGRIVGFLDLAQMESCFSTRYAFLCRKFVDLEPNVMATIKLFVRKRKLYHKDGKIAVDLETRLRKRGVSVYDPSER